MAAHSNILAWRITQRSVVAYSPWGRKELGTTECLTHTQDKITFVLTNLNALSHWKISIKIFI